MKVNQTTNICPRLKPVQLPLVGKWVSINSATRIFCRKAMMTGISSVRSWVIVICSLIPRAYLNSYFLAKIRTNCELHARLEVIVQKDVSIEVLRALLVRNRLLVIIDGFSERNSITQRKFTSLDPSLRLTRLVITSR